MVKVHITVDRSHSRTKVLIQYLIQLIHFWLRVHRLHHPCQLLTTTGTATGTSTGSPAFTATGMSTGTFPDTYFGSRNLGTDRPSIQCTACAEYNHWSGASPYNNYCTHCRNNTHAAHVCNAPSPVIFDNCGSSFLMYSLFDCHKTREIKG